MPRTVPSGIISCLECQTEHHRFARCADGVMRGARGNTKKEHVDHEGVELRLQAVRGALDEPEPVMDDAQRGALLERTNDVTEGESVEEMRAKLLGVLDPDKVADDLGAKVGDTGMTIAEIKAYPLITDPEEIERLTPEALRKELKIRAEMDKAAKAHEKREAELGVKLSRPEILRRTDDKAARILLNQLNHTLATAGVTERAATMAVRDLPKVIPQEEAQATHDLLGRLPQMREDKRHEAERKEALRTHVSGEVAWVCESQPEEPCYARVFYAASLEQVRRKGRAEPGWQLACPRCKGTRIRLADQREGVEAA